MLIRRLGLVLLGLLLTACATRTANAPSIEPLLLATEIEGPHEQGADIEADFIMRRMVNDLQRDP